MTPDCPVCGFKLEAETFGVNIYAVPRDTKSPELWVGDLECFYCQECKSDPSFPDQIRRNHEKIAAVRAAFKATGSPE